MSLDTSGKCSRCRIVVPPDVLHPCWVCGAFHTSRDDLLVHVRERVGALAEAAKEWPQVWVAYQKAVEEQNLGLVVQAKRRLNELAEAALRVWEESPKAAAHDEEGEP